jgi:hypothetical protein
MPTMPLNQLASLSEWLALRMLKDGLRMPSFPFERMAFPFRLGIRPEAEFSHNEKSISKRSLAGSLLYCPVSPAATA